MVNLVNLVKNSGLAAVVLLLLAWPGTALADNPTVSVEAPSHNVGDMGAALGDVWDGSSTGEIKWTQPDASNRRTSFSVQNGVGGAYGSVLKGVTPKGSDLASAYYVDANVSIPGTVYKYFVMRMFVAPHQAGESGKEATNGRILYSSQWGDNWLYQAFPYRRYSKPFEICGYGVWCTYLFNLSDSTLNSPTSPNPWQWGQSGAPIEAFGLWPHENWQKTNSAAPSGDSPDYFYIDYAYLVNGIVTSAPGQQYTVKWQVGDRDGGLISSKLYYQPQNELLMPSQTPICNSSLSGWTAISGGNTSISVGASPALPSMPYKVFLPIIIKTPVDETGFRTGQIGSYNQEFNWSLSSGTYPEGKVFYVCVEATDPQGNKSYAVGNAPVIKGPPVLTRIIPE